MGKQNERTDQEKMLRSSAAEYLTYVASTGDQKDSVEMRYEDENIWLTQKMMAALYDVDVRTINEHIKKIYADSELTPEATIRKFRIVQTEGERQVQRTINHYNLQMIIAVGFKVNSERAVQFRKWVNQIAKDYTIKGWVMDDERLKRGTSSNVFEKFVPASANFIKRSPTSMPQLLTTIKPQLQHAVSTPACKIRCTTLYTVTPLQS